MSPTVHASDGGPWRRYPPLAMLVFAGLLAAVVLPSSLNVQQPNPTETLEFAPVPPEGDDDAPPAAGNLASLSLGASSAGPADVGPPPSLPPGPPDTGSGATPLTKRCVGNPPRQTEDPLSPPCVGYFDGDNGGATAPGVTGDEVRVLFYHQGGSMQAGTSRGTERNEEHTFVDLGQPPADDEFVRSRMLRVYQRYFNDRFQTYGRQVRFVVHYGSNNQSPERKRADAAEGVERVDPFAVVILWGDDNVDAYIDEVARRGRLVFPSSDAFGAVGFEADFYRLHAPLLWSYNPTLQQRAELFTTYVCKKVVGRPVSFNGNGDNGEPRRLGLVYSVEAGRPDLTAFAELIRGGIERCGGSFAAIETYESRSEGSSEPLANMVALQEAGVTTVIWPGNFLRTHATASRSIGYRPEWVIAGDGVSEGTAQAQLADQEVMRHGRAVTTYTFMPPVDDRLCVRAAREADPSVSRHDVAQFGCRLYPDLRQLFTGIQVAGPRLTASSMFDGFHAIPAVRSPDPEVPACFYDPGDFACVKDAAAAWWDPDTPSPNGTPGCWRMMEGGRRYLAGAWPDGDVDRQRTASDPCVLFNFHPTPEP